MAVDPRVLRRVLVAAAVTVVLGASAALAADAGGRPESASGRAVAASPGPSDVSPLPRVTGIRAQLDLELGRQAAALDRGDADAFLAPVDPALRPYLARLFGSLRALRAVGTTMRVVADPVPASTGGNVFQRRRAGPPDDGRWRAEVELGFCPVVDGCGRAPTLVTTVWDLTGDAPRLVEYPPSTNRGPRPWEASDLRAVAGARVVVAGTARTEGRLASVLATAEQAAARADRYARWHPAPTRYLVYLADPDEWAQWYGGKQAGWVAGFAMPLAADHSEIVLNASRIEASETLATLTHEFAHVSTLNGVLRGYADTWVLVEGVAEYATHADGAPTAYRWLAGTRAYVRGGQWPGTAALAGPAEASSAGDATGRYGVAYLAVRRLAERFGEERMWTFFAAVVREARPPAEASPSILGADWPSVAEDCDTWIRTVTG